MALGARPLDILGLILGQAGRLVAVGLAFGIAGAWGLTRLMASQLYGVAPRDPATFAAAVAALTAVALAAALAPALRAARLAPLRALRGDPG